MKNWILVVAIDVGSLIMFIASTTSDIDEIKNCFSSLVKLNLASDFDKVRFFIVLDNILSCLALDPLSQGKLSSIFCAKGLNTPWNDWIDSMIWLILSTVPSISFDEIISCVGSSLFKTSLRISLYFFVEPLIDTVLNLVLISSVSSFEISSFAEQ